MKKIQVLFVLLLSVSSMLAQNTRFPIYCSTQSRSDAYHTSEQLNSYGTVTERGMSSSFSTSSSSAISTSGGFCSFSTSSFTKPVRTFVSRTRQYTVPVSNVGINENGIARAPRRVNIFGDDDDEEEGLIPSGPNAGTGNGDDDRTEVDPSERIPVGDMVFPLLLMLAAYALLRRRNAINA